MRNIQPIFSNRFLDTGVKILIVYATVHVAIMTAYAIMSGDYQTLNTFRILGLQLFFPGIDQSMGSFILSQGVLLVVAGVLYIRFTKKNP